MYYYLFPLSLLSAVLYPVKSLFLRKETSENNGFKGLLICRAGALSSGHSSYGMLMCQVSLRTLIITDHSI